MDSVMLLKIVTMVIVYMFSTKFKPSLVPKSMCNDEQVPLQLYFLVHLPPFLSSLCLFVSSNLVTTNFYV